MALFHLSASHLVFNWPVNRKRIIKLQPFPVCYHFHLRICTMSEFVALGPGVSLKNVHKSISVFIYLFLKAFDFLFSKALFAKLVTKYFIIPDKGLTITPMPEKNQLFPEYWSALRDLTLRKIIVNNTCTSLVNIKFLHARFLFSQSRSHISFLNLFPRRVNNWIWWMIRLHSIFQKAGLIFFAFCAKRSFLYLPCLLFRLNTV